MAQDEEPRSKREVPTKSDDLSISYQAVVMDFDGVPIHREWTYELHFMDQNISRQSTGDYYIARFPNVTTPPSPHLVIQRSSSLPGRGTWVLPLWESCLNVPPSSDVHSSWTMTLGLHQINGLMGGWVQDVRRKPLKLFLELLTSWSCHSEV